MSVVVATQSPDLFSQRGASVNLIRRSDQGIVDGRQIDQLGRPGRNDLLDMGFQPSDLLRRPRRFRRVAGEHDHSGLHALIGDQFRKLRIEECPCAGREG